MPKRGSKKKKKQLRTRTGVPVLHSDQDFLKAFEKERTAVSKIGSGENDSLPGKKNRHGLPELADLQDSGPGQLPDETPAEDEDFGQLLEAYFQNRRIPRGEIKKPVPLKKRLKRYPPPELELDLHGLNAAAAELKTRSFILTCKQRGFFTLRIIVGKGLHSEYGPVLPDVVEDLLRRMKTDAGGPILWYRWEQKKKTGSGAVVVYLKQFEQYDG